jgi:hypothetical protein
MRDRFDKAIKECLESIMGRRGIKIAPLADDASLSDVIAKMNELIDHIQ